MAPKKRMVARIGDQDWIKHYDLEAFGGQGFIVLTNDKALALVMDRAAWLEAYMASPEAKPLRDDGQPNRPLTGLSALAFEPAEDGP